MKKKFKYFKVLLRLNITQILSKKINGFILIEVALMLLIVGSVSYMLVELLNTAKKTYLSQKDEKKIEVILKMLAWHMVQYKYLPRPIKNNILDEFGSVPFKDLGLNKTDVRNHLGVNFTYEVASPFFIKSRFSIIQPNDNSEEISICGTNFKGLNNTKIIQSSTNKDKKDIREKPILIRIKSINLKTGHVLMIKEITLEHFLVGYANIICESLFDIKKELLKKKRIEMRLSGELLEKNQNTSQDKRKTVNDVVSSFQTK